MIIAIDFDGTLCQNAYPGIGDLMPGAYDAMQELHAAGHYLIIWTCRCGQQLCDAVNWLIELGIPFDCINDHCPANVEQYGDGGGKKVFADVYIDDRNLGGFPGWKAAMNMIADRPSF